MTQQRKTPQVSVYGYCAVHLHRMNTTPLHCLGIDQTKLTYRFQGHDFRLTDFHGAVIKGLLA
jgi:hypothetical protein